MSSLTGPSKPTLVAPPGARSELVNKVAMPAPTPAPSQRAINPILERTASRPRNTPNILIVGESGWGKTRSFKDMPWERTCMIDTENKGFDWLGKIPPGHRFVCDQDCDETLQVLDAVKDDPRFDYIIFDSFTGFSLRAHAQCKDKYKGYDIYTFYNHKLVALLTKLISAGKRIICTGIPEMLTAESSGNTVGVLIKRVAVHGKEMEGKVESFFSYAVYMRVTTVPGQAAKHEFVLSSDARSQAKVPEGVFKPTELAIPNDTYALIKRIEEAERAAK